MIWKFILIWSVISVVVALLFGQIVKVGSGNLSNWREYLPWNLVREIENNREPSVVFSIAALGAELAIFLVVAAIAIWLYLL